MSKYKIVIEQLSNSIKEIEYLTSFKNLSIEKSKKSNLLGKQIDKYIKLLVKRVFFFIQIGYIQMMIV